MESHMSKKLIAVFLATVSLATPAMSNSVTQAQRMLNQLGYNAGPVDGSYGGKTKRALESFYADSGSSFDGALDTNEVADLKAAMDATGTKSNDEAKLTPVSGVEIENNGSLLSPPKSPSLTRNRYWWTHAPIVADFNNDGYMDIWITGVQHQDEASRGVESEDTGDICGSKGYCDSPLTKPSLYINNGNGKYILRDDLVIDNRKLPGHSLARQNLLADYNGDGRLDVYIADHAIGNHKGIRDSYFLSQADGTLLESSDTHLSASNFEVFDHGAATGDIDGDGDIDVVITDTEKGGKIHCLRNDGTGYLKKRQCGSIFAFGIELADIDNDGDLDLIHAAHEFFNWNGNWKTGVALNNGRGSFSYRRISLPMNTKWGTIPEVSAWDLDADGDQDIVISRAGELYVGTAIEVLENLGNNKFDSKLYELSVAPPSFKTKSEGNEWNTFIEAIKFADVDGDADTDIMLINNGNAKLPPSSYLRNDGGMSFLFVKGGKGSKIKKLSNSAFVRR
jgi:hypothetical protein